MCIGADTCRCLWGGAGVGAATWHTGGFPSALEPCSGSGSGWLNGPSATAQSCPAVLLRFHAADPPPPRQAGHKVRKTSRRDLPLVMALRLDGATTVSATMLLAARAGVRVFVTGGAWGGDCERDGKAAGFLWLQVGELWHTDSWELGLNGGTLQPQEGPRAWA